MLVDMVAYGPNAETLGLLERIEVMRFPEAVTIAEAFRDEHKADHVVTFHHWNGTRWFQVQWNDSIGVAYIR